MNIRLNAILRNMEGVFVGDLRKVLTEEDYDQIYVDDCVNGSVYCSKVAGQFAFFYTEYGDGLYKDENSEYIYNITNGLIGVADLRALKINPKTDLEGAGIIVDDADKVHFNYENNVYHIEIYNQDNLIKDILILDR